MKKVSELEGNDLDYWVWRIEKRNKDKHFYRPSTDPAQAWSIIEREGISLIRIFDNVPRKEEYKNIKWYAIHQAKDDVLKNRCFGETALIAAMRCYVESVYGDEVGKDNEK